MFLLLASALISITYAETYFTHFTTRDYQDCRAGIANDLISRQKIVLNRGYKFITGECVWRVSTLKHYSLYQISLKRANPKMVYISYGYVLSGGYISIYSYYR